MFYDVIGETPQNNERTEKQMKKTLAMLLALVMIISCFVGCNQKPAEETKDTKPVETKPSEVVVPTQPQETNPALGQLPLTDKGETITIGIMQHANTENYDTNDYTVWVEEQTGVNLEFVYFSADNTEAMTQLNAMIAGGEKLPDILWYFTGMDMASMYELGEDGYFLDLTDYFNDYSYYFWGPYDGLPETQKGTIFAGGIDPSNGELYAYPQFGEGGCDSCATHAAINTTWLEALGAEVPTNVDELYELLKRFATEDPNGNGKADEIPMLGYHGGYRAELVDWILNAFVYVNATSMFNATDGQIWTPYTTDEYRQGLIYLNKLYTEGLISPVYYTITKRAEYKPLVTPADGVAISGVIGAHPQLHYETDSEILYEYTMMAPLEAATELGGYASIRPSTASYRTFITSDCENPELAFQLLDFMMSQQESVLRQRYGVLGRDWEWPDADGESYMGIKASAKIIDSSAYSSQNNACWHNQNTCSNQKTFGAQWDDDGTWSSHHYKLLRQVWDLYHSVEEPAEVVATLVYTSEENEKIGTDLGQINSYIDEAQAMFVSGVLNPNDDAQWNTYLANLEAQGLSQVLEVAQASYTRMLSN